MFIETKIELQNINNCSFDSFICNVISSCKVKIILFFVANLGVKKTFYEGMNDVKIVNSIHK